MPRTSTTGANPIKHVAKRTKKIPKKPDKSASERHARGTDPDIKAANLRRLARIEGQVRGVRQMVEAERYCADILDQIAAAQNALRAVARETLRNHLKHCAAGAMSGNKKEAEEMQEELLRLFEKRMY